jgi:hypothetical protein
MLRKLSVSSCLGQNTSQNHGVKIANKVFGYLGSTMTNKNCVHKEIKQINFVKFFLPFCSESLSSCLLLPNRVMINIYRTIILPVVLYWCATWCFTLWEECGLRAFKNGAEELIWA